MFAGIYFSDLKSIANLPKKSLTNINEFTVTRKTAHHS